MRLTTIEVLACGARLLYMIKQQFPKSSIKIGGVVIESNHIDKLKEAIIKFDIDENANQNFRNHSFMFAKHNMIDSYIKIYQKRFK